MRFHFGLLACAAALSAPLAAQAPGSAVKLVLVGDSTVAEGNGWGPGLRASFGSGVEVVNLALNGRSSKSFRDEGAWLPALAQQARYILIQFGHNDCPGKGPERETDPKTTYRANLTRYVEEARAAGAQPVLVSSIVRRNFDGAHIKPDALLGYVDEVRRLAGELKVPFIDLYPRTVEQAERLGPEGSRQLGVSGADGKPDTTHLGPRGQLAIGAMVAAEMARIDPALAPRLRSEALPPIRYVVAQDGSGDSKTIQYAVDHAPTAAPGQRLIIEIRPGIYRERVTVPQDRPKVTFLGTDAAKTVITAALSAKDVGGTFFSSSVNIQGAEFEAEKITFENTFGVGSQAVAVQIHSDRAVFRDCRFSAWQDTLYAAWGRQYYLNCFIEGHVDFIFGNAAAVFEGCEIRSRDKGYITAVNRTLPAQPTGMVFRNCRLTAADPDKPVFLGRPWRPYARTVFIDCWMDRHIQPEGWDNWSSAANEQTAWYAESGSSGPGGSAAGRAKWSHQLKPDELEQFKTEVFLRGNDLWSPPLSH